MFLPFGFFISYYLKVEKMYLPVFLTAIASISIEIVQMMIGRVFDVDDIILNLLGGICGFFIYNIIRIISGKLPKIFKSEIVLNIIYIIIFISLIAIVI